MCGSTYSCYCVAYHSVTCVAYHSLALRFVLNQRNVYFGAKGNFIENSRTGNRIDMICQDVLYWMKHRAVDPETVPSTILRSCPRVVAPVEDDTVDAWMQPFDPDSDRRIEAAAADAPLEAWLEPFDPADYEDHLMDDLNEEHNDGEVTHVPYQSWCDRCVAGRAQISPRKRRDKTQGEIPVTQMDYLEWTRKLLEADPNSGTMSLTLVDLKSGMMWGSMVLRKGAWPYVEEAVARFVLSLKYREVILQTDGEPAILLVARKIAAKLRASNMTVTTRQTPRYDSQANGPVENANEIVAARFRTSLGACASKYGVEFDTTSYLFPWAV